MVLVGDSEGRWSCRGDSVLLVSAARCTYPAVQIAKREAGESAGTGARWQRLWLRFEQSSVTNDERVESGMVIVRGERAEVEAMKECLVGQSDRCLLGLARRLGPGPNFLSLDWHGRSKLELAVTEKRRYLSRIQLVIFGPVNVVSIFKTTRPRSNQLYAGKTPPGSPWPLPSAPVPNLEMESIAGSGFPLCN